MGNKPRFEIGEIVDADVYDGRLLYFIANGRIIARELLPALNQYAGVWQLVWFYTVEGNGRCVDKLVDGYENMSLYKEHFVAESKNCKGYVIKLTRREIEQRKRIGKELAKLTRHHDSK